MLFTRSGSFHQGAFGRSVMSIFVQGQRFPATRRSRKGTCADLTSLLACVGDTHQHAKTYRTPLRFHASHKAELSRGTVLLLALVHEKLRCPKNSGDRVSWAYPSISHAGFYQAMLVGHSASFECGLCHSEELVLPCARTAPIDSALLHQALVRQFRCPWGVCGGEQGHLIARLVPVGT